MNIITVSSDAEDYDYLIGYTLRNAHRMLLGVVVDLKVVIDAYWKSKKVFAVLDNGKEVDVSTLSSVLSNTRRNAISDSYSDRDRDPVSRTEINFRNGKGAFYQNGKRVLSQREIQEKKTEKEIGKRSKKKKLNNNVIREKKSVKFLLDEVLLDDIATAPKKSKLNLTDKLLANYELERGKK